MSQVEILYGKGQGKGPPSKATSAQLENFIRWKGGELASGKVDERYRASTEVAVKAAEEELAARKAGKPEPTQAPSPAEGHPAALAKVPTTTLGQAIHDPVAVTAKLQELARQFHLVTPTTSIDVLPEGCGVTISFVVVNPDTSPNGPKEVYDVGGRLALSGDTLKRIAGAAGLTWDPRQTGRLDDGRDPHYCHYRAVGIVENFDSRVRILTGEVEIDARDGSPLIEEIKVKAKNRESKSDYKGKKDGGASQILELRKFLLRHAETKAKLRAIADMGIKRSYGTGGSGAPAELDKPFAVARLVWTGRSDDPEMRRAFALATMERMTGGVAALYGTQPVALPSRAPTAPNEFEGHAPPPVGGSFIHETDGFEPGGDDVPY